MRQMQVGLVKVGDFRLIYLRSLRYYVFDRQICDEPSDLLISISITITLLNWQYWQTVTYSTLYLKMNTFKGKVEVATAYR